MHCEHNEPLYNAGHWRLGSRTLILRPYRLLLWSVLPFAKLIQVKSATLQRFQLAFKHLLLLKKNSRLNPIFQDFAFNFQTFSRSGKVVRKFPDFFKNSRLCKNPVKYALLVFCPVTVCKMLWHSKGVEKFGTALTFFPWPKNNLTA